MISKSKCLNSYVNNKTNAYRVLPVHLHSCYRIEPMDGLKGDVCVGARVSSHFWLQKSTFYFNFLFDLPSICALSLFLSCLTNFTGLNTNLDINFISCKLYLVLLPLPLTPIRSPPRNILYSMFVFAVIRTICNCVCVYVVTYVQL